VTRTRVASLTLSLASILAACNGILGNDAVLQWNPDGGTGDTPSDGSSSGGGFVEGSAGDEGSETTGEDGSGGADSPAPSNPDGGPRDATTDATTDAETDADAASGDDGATCTSGAVQCSGNGVQTCSTGGTWGAPVVCSNSACVDGACTGTCSPGATRCSGNGTETCNASGQWGTVVNCTGSLVCQSGACTACPSGQTECSGACVNEQTDDNHCGSCTNVCPPGLKCAGGACPSISLVSHTNAASAAASLTTSAINTTGATLIVAACGWYTAGGSAVSCAITDSKTNAWQALGPYQESSASIQASYVVGPSTSATHTFTASTSPSCSGCYADIWVLAFGGVSASSISLQTSCGNTAGASPLSACSAFLTPTQASELLVAFVDTNYATSSLTYSINSGFTLVDSIATPGGATEGGGDAYNPLGPATPFDPAWTITGSEHDFATTLAAFVY
jgi:hypothetical protein